MAARHTSFGIAHPTVVPTNFDPETDRSPSTEGSDATSPDSDR